MLGTALSIFIISFHLNISPKRQVLLSLFRFRNRGSERLSNLLKDTQLVSGKTGFESGSLTRRVQALCMFPAPHFLLKNWGQGN